MMIRITIELEPNNLAKIIEEGVASDQVSEGQVSYEESVFSALRMELSMP